MRPREDIDRVFRMFFERFRAKIRRGCMKSRLALAERTRHRALGRFTDAQILKMARQIRDGDIPISAFPKGCVSNLWEAKSRSWLSVPQARSAALPCVPIISLVGKCARMIFKAHQGVSKRPGARVLVMAPTVWTYSNLRNPPCAS